MTASRDITLWCDDPGCQVWTAYGAGYNTVAATRRQARKNGWRFTRGMDFCPRHPISNPNRPEGFDLR